MISNGLSPTAKYTTAVVTGYSTAGSSLPNTIYPTIIECDVGEGGSGRSECGGSEGAGWSADH